jgi:hypothetical protein
MKNAVFWDMKPVRTSQETLLLRYRAQPVNVRYEVFTAVAMKNAVFLDVHHVALVRTEFQRNVSPPSTG